MGVGERLSASRSLRGRSERRLSLARRRCQRRDAAVGRIGHERGVVVELAIDHFNRAVRRVRVPVLGGVGEGRQEHGISCSEVAVSGLEDAVGTLPQFDDLLIRETVPSFEGLGALERCRAAADPHTLQVRVAVRRAGRSPRLSAGDLFSARRLLCLSLGP